MRLSAVMIVRNESSVIDRCLASLAGFDEVVVCDTGSQDDTVQKAKAHKNTRVFTDYTWDDDFASARNHALRKATGDWCMQVDADHVLVTPMEEVRDTVLQVNDLGHSVAKIRLRHGACGQMHMGAWLFKRQPGVFWDGRVHEVLNRTATVETGIVQEYGKSPSHDFDPTRNLRILEMSDKTPRNLFYLGRELFETGDLIRSIEVMNQYLKVATWQPEICEAYLTLARAYWVTEQGDLARDAALIAVRNNPMFKEAILFLSETHFEPWKSRWKKLAESADNESVLFVRVT